MDWSTSSLIIAKFDHLANKQSTFLKWSRDWYQIVNIWKKWLHNFCPNLNWTIDIKEFLFEGRFLVEKSNLSNIKLEGSPHFWISHLIDIKILIFGRSDFITFIQIGIEPSISKSSYFRVVFQSKSRIYWILKWKCCRPHLCNDVRDWH